MSVQSVSPLNSGTARRLASAAGLGLACLLFASPAARAVTFTAGSAFQYSGGLEFLSPNVLTIDTPNGFMLRGDYRVDSNAFIIGYRPFFIGPLPERIDSFATEHFKIVLAGGPSGAPGDGLIRARVNYVIAPVPLGPVSPNAAAGGDVQVVGNGLFVHQQGVAEVLDDVLPSARILAPGNYVLRSFVQLTFAPGAPAAFPVAGFIELGGLTNFGGVDVSIIGTPVPEPETYAMMLAGLGLLGFVARRRKQQAA